MFKEADKNLWVSFINGNDDSLNALYLQFVNSLYAFGLRYTDDAETVKDSIHDLFVDLYKYRKTLTVDVNVKSYLFTSLKRKICQVLKKESRKNIIEVPFLFSYSIEDQIIKDEQESELLSKLKKQLELLPNRQKEAIYLRFNSELEYEEIAIIMDISLETCRTLVYRGIKQLREKMVIQYADKIQA
jgi:RNA polymerase sigma factor (sigma-70 family)